jgi:hypothetical protein
MQPVEVKRELTKAGKQPLHVKILQQTHIEAYDFAG